MQKVMKEDGEAMGVKPNKLKKKDLDGRLLLDKDWLYYSKVNGHRSFLLAMSMYKHKRYGSKGEQEN